MTYIQKLSGDMLNLDEIGIRTKDFIIGSPAPEHSFETLENGLGAIDMGSSLGPRDITCPFKISAADTTAFGMFRDEIFNLFRGDEAFYLIEKRNPGKRWLVKCKDPYTIPQTYVYGDFEVNFTAFSGVAESLGTTLNPHEWDADVWQFGQGVPFDDIEYVFSRSRFNVFNAGNIVIDPRKVYMQLLISLKAIASDYIEIENKTTDETYRYDGTMTSSDTLRIYNTRSTKNSLSVYRDTNKKIISLAPGMNEFEIKGTSKIEEVSFDFRYYYN